MKNLANNYTHKALGSRKDRWNNNENIDSSRKPNKLSRKVILLRNISFKYSVVSTHSLYPQIINISLYSTLGKQKTI